MRSAYLLLGMMLLITQAQAQTRVDTPPPGSASRKAILDALRAPVQEELRQKVQFKVDVLRVQDGWAFVRGRPQKLDGTPIDYKGTKYAEMIEAGVFDDWYCALLRKQGDKWSVVAYSIGATDVVWEGWSEEHKAPSAIFE